MKDSILLNKSFDFSKRIIKLYKYLTEDKKEFVLSKQLLKSGTSIGANIREARYAQSKKDFISKMSIALKEASESEYWIELLKDEYLTEKETNSIIKNLIEIIKMLTKSIITAKENNNKESRTINGEK